MSSTTLTQSITVGSLEDLILRGHFHSNKLGELNLLRFYDCSIKLVEQVRSLHLFGRLHGDIQPKHILVTKMVSTGEDGLAGEASLELCLIGFRRCAKLPDGLEYVSVGGQQRQVVSTLGVGGGTPGFAAPEQLGWPRAIGAPQEVFGLIAVMYEAIAGHQGVMRAGIGRWCASLSSLPHSPIMSVRAMQQACHTCCMVIASATLRTCCYVPTVKWIQTEHVGCCSDPATLCLPRPIPQPLASLLLRGLSLDKHERGTDPGIRPSLLEVSQTLQQLQPSFKASTKGESTLHKDGLVNIPLEVVHKSATHHLDFKGACVVAGHLHLAGLLVPCAAATAPDASQASH